MMSDNQIEEKKRKILIAINSFLKGNKTIKEVSNETGISPSSVQRYLNDEDYIRELFDYKTANFLILEIKRRLKENKRLGEINGGNISSRNNEATKDALGHFTGLKRRQ